MVESFSQYVRRAGGGSAVLEMNHAGFKAKLMRAERLVGDKLFELPAGRPISIFPIASLPGSPDGWVREAGTYVCPVDSEWGLWFDWTMNDAVNTAIIPSVKGMNPITSDKLKGFGLEEYSDKCPKHGCALTHGNLCEECGYEIPPQNYVCSPNRLWWDGFRQADGSVRQFFFTDEENRDIASAVIGKENTVPAFGFAYYQPKNPRTPPQSPMTRGMSFMAGDGVDLQGATLDCLYTNNCSDVNVNTVTVSNSSGNTGPQGGPVGWTEVTGSMGCVESQGTIGNTGSNGTQRGILKENKHSVKIRRVKVSASSQTKKAKSSIKKSKSVSVAGGARINQELVRDNLGVDGWKEDPSAIIRLYFCFENQFRQIVESGGVKELKNQPEGYLKGLLLG